MKQRLLTITAALIAGVAAVMWALQGGGSAEPVTTTPGTWASPTAVPPVESPSTDGRVAQSAEAADDLYIYAIPVIELQGLAPDAAPGTRLDLWVAWQPPGTDRPDVLPLLKGVILERIVPPTLPEGPHAAILQVPVQRARRLILGHRFGSLSVMEPTTSST